MAQFFKKKETNLKTINKHLSEHQFIASDWDVLTARTGIKSSSSYWGSMIPSAGKLRHGTISSHRAAGHWSVAPLLWPAVNGQWWQCWTFDDDKKIQVNQNKYPPLYPQDIPMISPRNPYNILVTSPRNASDISLISPRYPRDIPKISSWYPTHILMISWRCPKKCLRYPTDIQISHKIFLIYPPYIPKSSPRYTQDIPKPSPGYPQDIPYTSPKNPKDVSHISPRYFLDILKISPRLTSTSTL